jgi:hypothetical protein
VVLIIFWAGFEQKLDNMAAELAIGAGNEEIGHGSSFMICGY